MTIRLRPVVSAKKETTETVPVSNVSEVELPQAMAVRISRTGALELASAAQADTSDVLGFISETVEANSAARIITQGTTPFTLEVVTPPDPPFDLYSGQELYLSATQPGHLTPVAPTGAGSQVVSVGKALGGLLIIAINRSREVVVGDALFLDNASGSNISVGVALYMDPAGVIRPADASTLASSGVIGIAGEELIAGQSGSVRPSGLSDFLLADDSDPVLPGDMLFLSASNPGKLTKNPPTGPGNVIVPVGRMVNSKVLLEIQSGIALP